jgi:ABC-2 type transport system ATP-binding protein
LDDVSVQLHAGEVLAVIGDEPDGAAELGRVFATLVQPDSGSYRVWGIDAEREPDRARGLIGFVHSEPGAYPRLTLREDLEFFAAVRGLERIGLVDDLLEGVGLETRGEAWAADLQTLDAWRLGLARALLGDPRLLVLQEPGRNLSLRELDVVRQLLSELSAVGTTLVLTGTTAGLVGICHRVMALARGRVRAVLDAEAVAKLQTPLALAPEQAELFRSPSPAPLQIAALEPNQDSVEFRFEDPAGCAHAAAVLHGLPEVLAVVSSSASSLSVRYAGPEHTIPRLLRALVTADVAVLEVVRLQNPLSTWLHEPHEVQGERR